MKNIKCRGFSVVELLVSVAIMGMVGAVLGPTVTQSRQDMRSAMSTANLQELGQAGAMYGLANHGRIFGYSWRAGETYMMPDGWLRTMHDEQEAAQFQNTEILQRRTGRIHGTGKILTYLGRLPHRRYSHLVLNDFMNDSIANPTFIDPNDRKQFYWMNHPLEYREEDNTLPYSEFNSDYHGYDEDERWRRVQFLQRWTFGSSYLVVPASWQQDYPANQYIPIQDTPHLYRGVHDGSGDFHLSVGRTFFEPKFHAQKVWMHEEFDRGTVVDLPQAGRSQNYQNDQQYNQGPIRAKYFAYDHARTEKLMFDLSVNSWASGDANSSRIEHIDGGKSVWRQTYVPLHQFPLPLGGLGDQTLLDMRFRWTFRGLKGVDYGAGDVGLRSGAAGGIDAFQTFSPRHDQQCLY